MGVNSLPNTVTRQRYCCDLNPGPSAPESSMLTTWLLSHHIEYFASVEIIHWVQVEGIYVVQDEAACADAAADIGASLNGTYAPTAWGLFTTRQIWNSLEKPFEHIPNQILFIVILVPTIGCRPCSSLLPSDLHVKFQLMLKFMCSYNWIVFTYLLCCLQCFDTVGWVVGCWRGYLSGSEVQTCIWPSWCHCHSLSLASVKSRLVLPFWYWLTRIVPEKGPLNVCVCVTYFAWYCSYQNRRWEHCELFVEQ